MHYSANSLNDTFQTGAPNSPQELNVYQGVNMAKRIAARFLPQEWVCKFCERANPIDQYQCQSCGWYRGIIADVVQEMGIWRPRE